MATKIKKDGKYCQLLYAIFSYAINDLDETFEYVLSTLTKREAMAVKFRFVDNLTFREIGETLESKVSAQRASNIVSIAIRKLSSPNVLNYIKYGKTEYDRILAKEEIIKKYKNTHNILDIPIEDMNLSIRTFNCLYRANKYTLRDIMCMSKDDLMKIRNMNRKGTDEIVSKLEEFGVSLK